MDLTTARLKARLRRMNRNVFLWAMMISLCSGVTMMTMFLCKTCGEEEPFKKQETTKISCVDHEMWVHQGGLIEYKLVFKHKYYGTSPKFGKIPLNNEEIIVTNGDRLVVHGALKKNEQLERSMIFFQRRNSDEVPQYYNASCKGLNDELRTRKLEKPEAENSTRPAYPNDVTFPQQNTEVTCTNFSTSNVYGSQGHVDLAVVMSNPVFSLNAKVEKIPMTHYETLVTTQNQIFWYGSVFLADHQPLSQSILVVTGDGGARQVYKMNCPLLTRHLQHCSGDWKEYRRKWGAFGLFFIVAVTALLSYACGMAIGIRKTILDIIELLQGSAPAPRLNI